MVITENNQADVQRQPLNIESVLDLWSRTYNAQDKPDWSHIFPYYHEEVIFQDPIQKIEGKQAFIKMCNRLTDRCEELHMEITSIAAKENIILMEWEMRMVFRRTPSTTLYGSTKLILGDDGRISQQRDYYDLWGDIFPNVPLMRRIYPSIMKWIFG